MKALGLVICSLCSFYAHAQLNFTAQVKGGFLIPHHSTMRGLMNHAQSLEVSAIYRVDSSHVAYRNLNKPSFGLIAGLIRNNNQTNNGNVVYTGLLAQKNLYEKKNRCIALSIAGGLGYSTKIFDIETNRANIAMGARVNGLLQIGLKHYWKISKQTAFKASVDLTHFSNGNIQMPNLGFNYLFLGLGLNRSIGQKTVRPAIHKEWNSTLVWELGLNYGRRQISIDDRQHINMASIGMNLVYPQSEIAQWRMGFNVFYDRSYVHTDLQALPKGQSLEKLTEIAWVGGHEYRMGKVGVTSELGIYLYRPSDKKRRYYEAIGLRFYPQSNLYLSTRLKVHLTSADYIEFGIGYQLKSKSKVKPGFRNGLRWIEKTLTFQK